MSTGSRKVKTYRCALLKSHRPEDALFSRQSAIPGFDQEALANLEVGMVGAGGLNGEIGEGLVRKGVGSLWFVDFDRVEVSNLNRQFFGKRDLFKPKALRLPRNLSRLGFGGTRLKGVDMSFEFAVEEGLVDPPGVLVVGVDSNGTRTFGARYALANGLRAVFTAVSRDGNNGYVFVQEPGKACYGCLFGGIPGALRDPERRPCTPDPAVKDILKVVAGFVLYAVDSLVMPRPRTWNYRELFLSGFVQDRSAVIERKESCPLCGKGTA